MDDVFTVRHAIRNRTRQDVGLVAIFIRLLVSETRTGRCAKDGKTSRAKR